MSSDLARRFGGEHQERAEQEAPNDGPHGWAWVARQEDGLRAEESHRRPCGPGECGGLYRLKQGSDMRLLRAKWPEEGPERTWGGETRHCCSL